MLAYREWRLRWDDQRQAPVLCSVFSSTTWDGQYCRAHAKPAADNLAGLYARTPQSAPAGYYGTPDLIQAVVVGAVDAFGKIVEHNDGIIRAERARILSLRILPAHCEHTDLLVSSGRCFEPETILYCSCAHRAYCPCEPYAPGARKLPFAEVERLLLERYAVPRLPEGIGPWPPPVGSGPRWLALA